MISICIACYATALVKMTSVKFNYVSLTVSQLYCPLTGVLLTFTDKLQQLKNIGLIKKHMSHTIIL